MLVRIVLALLTAALIAIPAHAKKGSGVPVLNAPENAGYIQLRSIMAPVVHKKNGRRAGTAPITVVLETIDKDNIIFICRNAPRVIDGMLQILYKNPIKMNSKRQFDFVGLNKSVLNKTNKVLRKKVITRVFLFSASRQIGDTGGVVSKLPFSSVLGCRAAKTEEEANKAKAKD
jgi:hypothetical protein